MRSTIVSHSIGLFLFFTIFIAASVFTGFGNDAKFSSEAWLAADVRGRGRMAHDLIDGGSLLGKCPSEVRSTLGAPDRDWGKVYQYQINLGWPVKNPMSYGLQVRFDDDRTVRLVKIVD
jgi:hypothetical protein